LETTASKSVHEQLRWMPAKWGGGYSLIFAMYREGFLTVILPICIPLSQIDGT